MSTNNLSYSSELITNYLQAEIMSPDESFEALQTSTGCALLFSIGTDGVFYVTAEASAQSTNGWMRTDLSTARVSADFPGAKCTKMSAGQNIQNNTLGLAMVASLSGSDHLYLWLGNSNSDMSWLSDPQWVSYPFDNPAGTTISIVNVFLSETTTGQFIVVDILSDPTITGGPISRYYIDTKATVTAWVAHDLPVALDASGYVSCLGRIGASNPDGMYCGGNIDGSAQLAFSALFNPWGSNAPTVSLFKMPNSYEAESVAACRYPDDTTSLFITSNGALYYLDIDNQKNGSTASMLFANPVFVNVSKLYANLTNGIVTVWGLNSAGTIFYTSCCAANIGTKKAAWSLPVPILVDVDMASPYINVANNGNTIFAVAGSELFILTKSPETSVWTTQQIMLPPSAANTPALSFKSYTTHLLLTDQNNIGVPNTPLAISASTRTNFYINNLYTVLDTTPININTDSLGKITLIQCVGGIQGTQLTITDGTNAPVQINPMDAPYTTLSQLSTADSINGATITYQNGTTKKLVSANASSDDVTAAATANQSLKTAYTNLAKPTAVKATVPGGLGANFSSTGSSGIVADFGDICNWIASGVENVISIVENDAKSAWNFVVTIAGDVYTFVLDCVEKVVSAVQWVFNKIIDGIEDLIDFLKYLFDLADIERTKGIITNLMTLSIQNVLDQIADVKQQFDSGMGSLENAIAQWAGIKWDGLPPSAGTSATAGANSSSNSSVSSNYLSGHFQNNAGGSQFNSSGTALADDGLSILTTAIDNEDSVFQQVSDDISTLISNFSNLSIGEILKQLVGIIGDALVTTAQVVGDAIFTFLEDMVGAIASVLNSPVYIPVVSDVLNDFGVTMPSVIDILGWIAAVPATIIYKIATGKAPFQNAAEATFLSNATTMPATMFAMSSATQATAPKLAASATSTENGSQSESYLVSWLNLSQDTQNDLFVIATYSAASFSLVNAFLLLLAAAESSPFDNSFTSWTSGFGLVGTVCSVIASQCYYPYPISNDAVSDFKGIATGYLIALKARVLIARWKPINNSDTGAAATKAQLGKASASMDCAFGVAFIICSCFRVYEAFSQPSGNDRDEVFINEGSTIASNLGKVFFYLAAMGDKPALVGLMISNAVSAGLKFGEAIEFQPATT